MFYQIFQTKIMIYLCLLLATTTATLSGATTTAAAATAGAIQLWITGFSLVDVRSNSTIVPSLRNGHVINITESGNQLTILVNVEGRNAPIHHHHPAFVVVLDLNEGKIVRSFRCGPYPQQPLALAGRDEETGYFWPSKTLSRSGMHRLEATVFDELGLVVTRRQGASSLTFTVVSGSDDPTTAGMLDHVNAKEIGEPNVAPDGRQDRSATPASWIAKMVQSMVFHTLVPTNDLSSAQQARKVAGIMQIVTIDRSWASNQTYS
jgi:hypothetical protein